MRGDARVFVTSDDGLRAAVAFHEFGVGTHGPFAYVDDDDAHRILRMRSMRISAHRCILTKNFTEGAFASFFTLGITLGRVYHPVHTVERVPFYSAKLNSA
jgi:hypothetical protein